MKEKKPIKNYEDLPDTITPNDYAEWRGCGENKAYEIFNSKGFPLIKGIGTKKIADKRAVLFFEMGLNEKERAEVLKEMAREIIRRDTYEKVK